MICIIIMNENIFDDLKKETGAYWLGFLYADGNHFRKNPPQSCYKISLGLSLKDIDHVKKFCKDMNIDENRISIHPPGISFIKSRQIVNSGQARIQFSNRSLSNRCLKIGLVPKKSLVLNFPSENIIPNESLCHFVRGYFDGDGCLTKVYNNHATRYRVIIVSSRDFCSGLCERVNKLLNIRMKMWDKKNTNVNKTCISGNRQVKMFMDWVYNNATVYLKRKHVLFNELCEKIKSIDDKNSNNYSKYNNITFDKSRNKWIASVRFNKRTIRIGRFNTEKEAINAQTKFELNRHRISETNSNPDVLLHE